MCVCVYVGWGVEGGSIKHAADSPQAQHHVHSTMNVGSVLVGFNLHETASGVRRRARCATGAQSWGARTLCGADFGALPLKAFQFSGAAVEG